MHFKQYGGALIEGLIAMLILTIGVLGLIAMQGNLLTNSTKANLRLKADLLANELAAMVMADNTNANCYIVPTSTQTGCANTAARTYTDNWVTEVNNNLPGSNVNAPSTTLNADGTFTIRLFWQLPQDGVMHNLITTTHIGI